ncbi:MAG: MFS transporter [Candidatus Omnitrophota bacterium]|nr:MFS transporter [Candidatus Omnitrophota bacterium]
MKERQKIKKSLRASFIDGIFVSGMVGLTTDYITPYALALKATITQIGYLNSIPNFISSLLQLKSADVTEKLASRKKVINIFVLLHVLMGIPIILVPYLFKGNSVFYLIVFVTLFNAFNAFTIPAWASLMADHIPENKRGRYFGWRNKILGSVVTVFSFLAGFILFLFKKDVLKGFIIIFSLAFICRAISWYFLTRMYEPRFKVKKDNYFSFLDFIRRIKTSNFAKFVVFVSGLNFCVNIAAPFFAVFMLRDLRLSYLTYTILITTVSLTGLLTIEGWGRRADRIGNLRVLRFTSFFIATLPLWWIINHNPLYLILIQILSGFAWSGFNLCATNFIFDCVSPSKRIRCIAYFNVLNGSALCLGAILGGYLVNHLPNIFGFQILSLFFLSGILRLLVVFYFSGKIREVRQIETISSRDFFYSVIGLRQT